MADEETFAAPLEIHTLTGDLSVAPSNDGHFSIFRFAGLKGPVRVAVRNEDLPRLIATAAHAYSPEMPSAQNTGPRRALPASAWRIQPANGDMVALSFEMGAGAALTFLVPRAQVPAMIEALSARPAPTSARPSGTPLN